MLIKSIEKLTSLRWINLYETHFQNRRGTDGRWTHASRRPAIAPGQKVERADAVVVVPILDGSDGKRLVMIKEYRVPLQGHEYGFPAGLVEAGEPYEETARRELKEETNLELTRVRRVSPLLFSSAGMVDESAVMVFADCAGTVSTEGNEGDEEIEVLLLSHPEVVALAHDPSRMVSAKAWPLLYLFEQLGSL